MEGSVIKLLAQQLVVLDGCTSAEDLQKAAGIRSQIETAAQASDTSPAMVLAYIDGLRQDRKAAAQSR